MTTVAEVHHHPDGWVFVRGSDGVYQDLPENLAKDFGEHMSPLPVGATERFYSPAEGRHIFSNRVSIIGVGDVPWDFGDRLIAALPRLLKAHADRQPKPLPQSSPPPRDLTKEIDDLVARVAALEAMLRQ